MRFVPRAAEASAGRIAGMVRPGGNMPPALPGLVSPQLGARSLAGTGAGGNRAMADAAALADSADVLGSLTVQATMGL